MLGQVVDLPSIEAGDVAEALAPELSPAMELVVADPIEHGESGGVRRVVALLQRLERLGRGPPGDGARVTSPVAQVVDDSQCPRSSSASPRG